MRIPHSICNGAQLHPLETHCNTTCTAGTLFMNVVKSKAVNSTTASGIKEQLFLQTPTVAVALSVDKPETFPGARLAAMQLQSV